MSIKEFSPINCSGSKSMESMVESVNDTLWDLGMKRNKIILVLRLQDEADHRASIKAQASSFRSLAPVALAISSMAMGGMSIAFTLNTKWIVDSYKGLADKFEWLPSGFLQSFVDDNKGAIVYKKITKAAEKILSTGQGFTQQIQTILQNFASAHRTEVGADGDTAKGSVAELDRQSHDIRSERQQQIEAMRRFDDAILKAVQTLCT